MDPTVVCSSIAHWLLQLVSRTVVACIGAAPHSHGHSAVHCLSAIEATISDNTSAVSSGRTKYLKIFAKILSIKLQPAAGLVSSALEKSGYIY